LLRQSYNFKLLSKLRVLLEVYYMCVEPGYLSGIVLGYRLDDWGFESWWQGLGIFLFTTVSRPALGPTQPPIQWVPGNLSLGVKWHGCEADHLPPSKCQAQECMEQYLHSLNTPSWCGSKSKHKDNFTFTLYYICVKLKVA
jgi:hypothetical protein